MQVDHIIIGQGISGTMLSRALIAKGATVLVVNDTRPGTASKVASGIINPVTGMRHVRSWMTEILFPFAQNTYETLEKELDISIVQRCDITDLFATREAQEVFAKKAVDIPEHLSISIENDAANYFRFNYGGGKISPCLLVDINNILIAWEKKLKKNNSLLEEVFDWQQCAIKDKEVIYKDIKAKNVICCDGIASMYSRYWDILPWSKDKGEALIVSIPELPADQIYRQHINIVPWKNGQFWVGASHDWKFTDLLPTPAFRAQTEERLKHWLRLPFAVTDHIVSQRPANLDRKPFCGLHPKYASLGIFNGMGSKGCSMSPWFAEELAAHLTKGAPIMPDVDVKRFARILSK